MFGVPYYYGFAYFPATFLCYLPFRWIEPSQNAIRIGNAFWLAALVVGVSWLAFRLAPTGPAGAGRRAGERSSFSPPPGSVGQLFYFGITDMVIAVYVLLALMAISYRSPLIAGCAIGLAFAAKLLPSALLAR